VLKILDLNFCNLNSELELIRFVDRWAASQINKQEHAVEMKKRKLIEPKILPMIHFLALTKAEFLECCSYCNWLTTLEKQEILQSIATKKISQNFPSYLSKVTLSICKNLTNPLCTRVSSSDTLRINFTRNF